MIIKTLQEFETIESESLPETNYFCDIPENLYHSISPMGHSNLCKYKKNAANFALKKQFKTSKAMELGSAIHCMILEPHLFPQLFAIVPKSIKSRRSKEYQEWYDMFGVGMTVIDEYMMEKVIGCTQSVVCHPDIGELFTGGLSEHVGIATDEETGIRMKMRMDKYHPAQKTIVDLKTTAKDASSKQYLASIADYNYMVQAAYYRDMADIIDGDDHEFHIVVVETEAPYSVLLYTMEADAIELGRKKYRKYLKMHMECSLTGIYPGYEDPMRIYTPPKWAYD